MANTSNIDRAAIGFSLVCAVHCAVLPVFAVGMPIIGLVAGAEWIHWLFTALAIGAAMLTVIVAYSARVPSFVVPATAGISSLVFALAAEPLGFDETIPTLVGAALLAAAHFYRLLRNH